MPRYFFDTSDGEREVDTDGVELPDVHVARTETIKYAGAFVSNEPGLFDTEGSVAVILLDEGRKPLLRVTISVAEL